MDNLRQQLIDRVLLIVSEETGVPVADIKSKNKKFDVADARKMFTAFMKDFKSVDFTLEEISSQVNVTHSMVVYNRNKIEDYIFTEPKFKAKYESIIHRAQKCEVLKKLVEQINRPAEYSTPKELKAAIELHKDKIQLLENWLIEHPENPYRIKIQRDVREEEASMMHKLRALENM